MNLKRLYDDARNEPGTKFKVLCWPIAVSYLTGHGIRDIVAAVRKIDSEAFKVRGMFRANAPLVLNRAFGLRLVRVKVNCTLETAVRRYGKYGPFAVEMRGHVAAIDGSVVVDNSEERAVWYKDHPLAKHRIQSIVYLTKR